MAKKTPKEIDKKIKTIRWLRWECLRRKKDYQTDVENLLKIAKRKSKIPTTSTNTKKGIPTPEEILTYTGQYEKIKAYAQILKVYDKITDAFSNLGQKEIKNLIDGFFLKGKGKTEQESAKTKNYIRKHSQISRYISECLKLGRLKLTLELKKFQKRWRLKFPINPNIVVPINRLLISLSDYPIIAHSYNPDKYTLIIKVDLNGYKEIIRGYIKSIVYECCPKIREGHIHQSIIVSSYNRVKNTITLKIDLDSPKRMIMSEIGKTIDKYFSAIQKERIQPKEDYEKCFKVWGLRPKLTYEAIAKVIYPYDFKDPLTLKISDPDQHQDVALVKVKQYHRRAGWLIKNVN